MAANTDTLLCSFINLALRSRLPGREVSVCDVDGIAFRKTEDPGVLSLRIRTEDEKGPLYAQIDAPVGAWANPADAADLIDDLCDPKSDPTFERESA